MLHKEHEQFFAENGYLLLKNVLADEDTEAILDVIRQVVDRKTEQLYEAGRIADKFEQEPVETRWARVCAQHPQKDRGWNTEVFSSAIHTLCSNPKLMDVCESYLGPEITVNGDFWIRPKVPHEDITTIPWHQDSFYYNGLENGKLDYKILSIWAPFVDVDENNGCLQVIPGSHKWGVQPYKRVGNEMLPIDDPALRGEVVTVRMNKGDLFLFNQLTMHRSLPNVSDGVRWSIDMRFTPTSQSFGWAELGDSFDEIYPGFIARSASNPGSVQSWDDWNAKKMKTKLNM